MTHHGASIPHVPRQHLLHQHVGRLDADADYAGQQQHRGVRPLCRSLRQVIEPRLLDLADLSLDDVVALQIALERGQRIRRDRLTLQCA
jgi:hypothetical protein